MSIIKKIRQYSLSPKLRKVLSNTGWLFSEKLLQMALGLVVGVWVARYLGPEQFGLLNYALAFTLLFSPLAKLGLDRIVVRDLVQNESEKAYILGTAFTLKLIGSILAYVLILIVCFVFYENQFTGFLISIVGLKIWFEVFNVIDFWFQSQVTSKYTVWSKNIAYLLSNALKIILIYIQKPLVFFAWNTLLESFLSAVGLVFIYQSIGHKMASWKVDFNLAKKMLKDSLPLMFSGMVVMIYLRVDVIMLGQIFGNESVGIYSVATRISELWYFFPNAIVSSVSPAIIEAKSTSEALYEQRLKKLFTIMTALAYLVAIPMTIFATPIIVLMYGRDYSASGGVLAIHVWASLFVFLGLAKGIWIIAEGLTKFALISTMCGAIVNVLLNLFLIPRYREIGAAIATIISYGCADYLIYIIYPPFRKVGAIMTEALVLKKIWSRE